MRSLAAFVLLLSFFCLAHAEEESFLLVDAGTNEVIFELGTNIDQRVTPRSTFKIALCLMGFDAGILKNQENPVWDFQEGYVAALDAWKKPQTPYSWIKNSCLWYSQVLAVQLGLETIQDYLTAFEYGNQDISGGLTTAWLGTSLEISPREQVNFIRKMIQGKLLISREATLITKSILLLETLSEGWELYGKTGHGWEGSQPVGWFVGWVEKGEKSLVFAYIIREDQMNPRERIPRVKQLLSEVWSAEE